MFVMIMIFIVEEKDVYVNGIWDEQKFARSSANWQSNVPGEMVRNFKRKFVTNNILC